jgi:co-chaperonin GroES (HSP10)
MPKALKMVHDREPKEVIWERMGGADKQFRTMGDHVLVAIYERPEMTAGGIILTDYTKGEDKFQGKVGLVIQLGDLAFQDDDSHSFPVKPSVGDWVVFFPLTMAGTALAFPFVDQPMRLVRDVEIRAIVTTPDLLW